MQIDSPPAARPSNPTQCLTGERVVYACHFGRKVGSLCLGTHSIHYRFGPHGHPDVDVGNTPDWGNVHYHELFSHAASQDHFRLSVGEISYVIHSGEAGDASDVPGKRFSGIAVLKGLVHPQQLANLECRSHAQINDIVAGQVEAAAPGNWDGSEAQGGPFDVYY